MTRACALGVDVSTAELRVHLLDLDSAETIGVVTAPLPSVTGADGRREQDADYGALALAVIDRAISAAGPLEVRSLSITATSGTVVPVDANGRQRGPARMYDDTTASPLERHLTSCADGRPAGMLARAAELVRDRAGLRAASVADVIGAALTGERVPGDTSHFLKSGIDPVTGEWADGLIERSGLRREQLPTLVQPGEQLGVVTVGSAAGAMLVAGMTDGCTSQLATGTVRLGQSVGVVGTTFVLKVVEATERRDAASGVYSHRAPDDSFWSGGASNAGGGSFALPTSTTYEELGREATASGPTPYVAYPLPRDGERFPVADRGMRPIWLRLDGSATAEPADPVLRYRAVLEGVALVERFALETLGIVPEAATRTLSGGATRSDLWNGIRAATLGTSVRIPTGRDSGHGAAVLAAWRAIGGDFTAAVARYTGGGSQLDPDPSLTTAMAERYAVFRETVSTR